MDKVLIVNDDEDLVEVTALVLEEAGYDVAQTVDGASAVALAREHAPDVIVLDLVLSNTDGGTVLAALRSDAVTREIPVVMISALYDGLERAKRAGANGFLAKPFSAEQLVDAIARTIPPRTSDSGSRKI